MTSLRHTPIPRTSFKKSFSSFYTKQKTHDWVHLVEKIFKQLSTSKNVISSLTNRIVHLCIYQCTHTTLQLHHQFFSYPIEDSNTSMHLPNLEICRPLRPDSDPSTLSAIDINWYSFRSNSQNYFQGFQAYSLQMARSCTVHRAEKEECSDKRLPRMCTSLPIMAGWIRHRPAPSHQILCRGKLSLSLFHSTLPKSTAELSWGLGWKYGAFLQNATRRSLGQKFIYPQWAVAQWYFHVFLQWLQRFLVL